MRILLITSLAILLIGGVAGALRLSQPPSAAVALSSFCAEGDGVSVSYTTAYRPTTPAGYRVTGVTVSQIAAQCDGERIAVQLGDESTADLADARAEGIVMAPSVSLSLASSPAAADVGYVRIEIGTSEAGELCDRPGARLVIGSDGRDVINAGRGPHDIRGLGGPDVLNGKDGNDCLDGGPGDDILHGQRGDDILYGGPGNDRLYGGPGNDILHGGPGDDRLFGGEGDDVLYGGPGRNVLHGGGGFDRCYGNAGDTFVGCEEIIIQ